MATLQLAHIPFNIRLADGLFKGEAIGIGNEVVDNGIFEIKLKDGSSFLVKAEKDWELRRFNWTTQAKDILNRLAPIIGRAIERYYSRRAA